MENDCDDKSRATPGDDIREYNRDEPVALDDRDPGNTSPEEMTEPLDPDDDVYSLIQPDHQDGIRTTDPENYGH